MDIVEKKLNVLNSYKNKLITFYGYPLKEVYFEKEDLELEELLDAIVYKFNKIQSIIGEKLFKLMLSYAGLDCENKSFLDILAILEKEGILNIKKWREIRTFRNSFAHFYPQEIEEIVFNVNEMIKMIDYLNEVFINLKSFKEKIDETFSK